jgi:5-methylcytosine-specific restriction enzyme A
MVTLPLVGYVNTGQYDVAVDFAVLCSNCHRMIHRFADPSNLAAFQSFINASAAGQ